MSDVESIIEATNHEFMESIDPDKFRTVLGHYPTGVVVVSSIDDDGEPVGMVVGSFTSASLDPPLVAYLPSRNSRSYQKLRHSPHFVINVLSADQEALCRVFAARGATDKWAGVSWSKSSLGLPILDDAVAWIECEVAGRTEAGDHDIVLGKVVDIDSVSDKLPLIFFQGGYGRFTPRSLVTLTEADLIGPLQVAERARAVLESLGEELGLESGLQAAVKEDLVLVAAFTPVGAQRSPSRVGDRLPLVPPLGSISLAWADDARVESWFGRSPVPLDDSLREVLRAGLGRVRERGFSVVLHAPIHSAIDEALRPLAISQITPYQQRNLLSLLPSLIEWYEPESLELGSEKRVRVLSVPVRNREGTVVISLQLRELPAGLSEAELHRLADRLRRAADAITETL